MELIKEKLQQIAVLRGSNSPAILIELGFITNQEDVRLYTSKQDK